MSWNRTYRPAQVADLHLNFVRTQIQRMMDSGKIPQALLFAGPKGTGKTSTSRIIGALVNDPINAKIVDFVYLHKGTAKNKNQKLEEPDPHSDFNRKIFAGTSFVVQEMDAASNRGIDDIRQLKLRAHLPPQTGKMSVFILDEAHMLTTEAFNALLKLLEEPPEHVIFILATTEIHKIPDTIISRCQLVEFKKATIQELSNRLKVILLSEKIEFEEDAIKQIAQNADGSFRDAVKLLELSAQSGKVDLDSVNIFTSASISSEIEQLLKHLLNKDDIAVVTLFESLREKSIDQKYFHKTLLDFLHTCLLQNLKIKPGESMLNKAISQFLLQELSNSQLSITSPIEHLRLELKILELIDRSKNKSGSSIKKNPKTEFIASEVDNSYQASFQAQVNREDKVSDTVRVSTSKTTEYSQTEYSGDASLLNEKWQEFIELLAVNNSTLASLLRSAKLVSTGEHSAVVGVYYSFHQEQLSHKKATLAIQESIKDLFGDYIELEFILLKTPDQAELVEPQKTDSLIDTAMQTLL